MSNSFVTPWTTYYKALLSMGFPRQEYWSRLSFPCPENLPNPGIEPHFLHWVESLLLRHKYICICWAFWYFWATWIFSLLSVINFGKFSVMITSNILFFFFCNYSFCNCPLSLGYSVFSFSFFSFSHSVLGAPISIFSQAHWLFP